MFNFYCLIDFLRQLHSNKKLWLLTALKFLVITLTVSTQSDNKFSVAGLEYKLSNLTNICDFSPVSNSMRSVSYFSVVRSDNHLSITISQEV